MPHAACRMLHAASYTPHTPHATLTSQQQQPATYPTATFPSLSRREKKRTRDSRRLTFSFVCFSDLCACSCFSQALRGLSSRPHFVLSNIGNHYPKARNAPLYSNLGSRAKKMMSPALRILSSPTQPQRNPTNVSLEDKGAHPNPQISTHFYRFFFRFVQLFRVLAPPP